MVNITLLCATRPRLLQQALGSIGDLSDATVTVRDAGMNGEVETIVREWVEGKRRVARGVCPQPLGTGPARNEVIRKSEEFFGRGDYLYLSDDDVCWTRPDWLNILCAAYDKAWDEGFRVVGAYNHPFNGPIPLLPWIKTEHGDLTSHVFPVWALASQSMLMKWEVWDQFGPFCDTPAGKVCQSEDVDFCNRIRAAGFKVGVIRPSLLINTGITNSFGEHIPGWEMVKAQCPEGVACE